MVARLTFSTLLPIVCIESNSPALWKFSECGLVSGLDAVVVIMVIITMDPLATILDKWFCFSAKFSFEGVRMILAFVPAMTLVAFESASASILVNTDGARGIPVGTHFTGIVILMGFASKVLPVVSVDASFSIMRRVDKWTPHRFVMEIVEVCILN